MMDFFWLDFGVGKKGLNYMDRGVMCNHESSLMV